MIESNVHKLIDRKTGETIFPGTVTEGVAHLQTKTDLNTLLTEYDLTRIWPDRGTEDEGASNLETALEVLDSELLEEQKVLGVTIKFLGEKDTSKEEGEQRKWEIWKYYDVKYDFSDPLGWIRLELDTLVELEKDSYYRIALSVEEGKSLVEVPTTLDTVEISWSVYYREEPVTDLCVKKFNNEEMEMSSRGIILRNLSLRSHIEYEYSLEAVYHKMRKTAFTKIIGVHPSYIGVVENSFNPTENYIKEDCTKVLLDSNTYLLAGDSLDYQKICFAYPTYFGELSEIKDNKTCIDWLDSFTRKSININSVPYYVYLLTSGVTISKGFNLTFK